MNAQTWCAPADPGPEVQAVRDNRGVLWTRGDGLWWGDIGHGYDDHRTWAQILARGPLVDATGEAA